jgi:hypothetical protein
VNVNVTGAPLIVAVAVIVAEPGVDGIVQRVVANPLKSVVIDDGFTEPFDVANVTVVVGFGV